MATVSIVTPTYNRAAYLKEAVESVRAQSYRDWELIVVDDGSTDATKATLQRYAKEDPRIRVMEQSHGGAPHARNTAIRQAKSKYIAFIDDDDVWLPAKLEKQVHYLEAHPEIGLVFHPIYEVDGELRPQKVVPQEWRCSLEGLLEWNFIPMSSVMVRRLCLERVGLFPEHLSRSEDYDLWLRVAQGFAFHGLKEPLVFYRRHGDNTSKEPRGMYEGHLWVYGRMLKDHPAPSLARRLKERIARDHYELGRIYKQNQSYLQAAKAFARSVIVCPWVGLQLKAYHEGLLRALAFFKPYAAIAYCLWMGLRNLERKEAVAA